MSLMFRSPEDISSSSSDSSTGVADMDDGHLNNLETPLGQSPEETISRGNNIPPPPLDDNGSYNEITAGPPQDHGGALDLDADGHASLMTAALLEFYCKSRAVDILNEQPGAHGRFTQDSPDVKILGKRLYEYKSRFLSSHGVIANGIDGDDWDSARQYYRESLDTLGLTALEGLQLDGQESKSPPNGATSSPSSPSKLANRQTGRLGLQRRITNKGNITPVLEAPPPNFTTFLQLPRPASASLPLLRQPSSHATPQASRYAAEFTEIKLIGKGSFGSVYHVNNHVDGQSYAVKKIPITGKRLRQLQAGLRDLENILKEIRTLARLDHLNIVRYFGAWVEHSASSLVGPSSGVLKADMLRQPLLSQDPANNDESEAGIVFKEDSGGVVFGDSSLPAGTIDDTENPSSYSTPASARSRKSHSFGNGEDDDDEVESIPRQFSIPSQDQTTTVSGTDDDIFTDGMGENLSRMQVGHRNNADRGVPAITLHIQMALHPLSLATYLSPLAHDGIRNHNPRHCYHIAPSLKMILGILSGVEYLHAKGIVHRDLKPGNIFLSHCETNAAHVCPSCMDIAANGHRYTIPRIGDFGLVAEISEYGEQSPGNDAPPAPHDQRVGTEFYRPPLFTPPSATPDRDNQETPDLHHQSDLNQRHRSSSASYINEKLDVFAVGVILFELLYKLDTRMERQAVLFNLTRAPNNKPVDGSNEPPKNGASLPSDFSDKVNDMNINPDGNSNVSESIVACIQGMLDVDPDRRWSCKAVRACLERILSSTEEATSPSSSSPESIY